MRLQTLQQGRYKIISILGQGGYGITYLAEQTTLGRQVAIKEFFMKDYCGRAAGSPEVTLGTDGSREMLLRYREKFKKEAATLARLNHPNIVRVIDMFEENNTYYYVMEYADGPSLSQIVKTRGKLPANEAFAMIRQVADAVSYLHQKDLCHYDIKPANILTNTMDKAILADFGLAKQYDEQGEETSTTPVGKSKGYAPPEQYKAGGISAFSPETDIYALAATLYKLLTGLTPIESISRVDEEIDFTILPVNFAGPIRCAMNLKRLERYHSVEEFMEAIKIDEIINDITNDPTEPDISNYIANDEQTEPEKIIKDDEKDKMNCKLWLKLKKKWKTEEGKKKRKKTAMILSVVMLACCFLFNTTYWLNTFFYNPLRAHEVILVIFILLNIICLIMIFSSPIGKKALTWSNILMTIGMLASFFNIYVAYTHPYRELDGIALFEDNLKGDSFTIVGTNQLIDIQTFTGKYTLINKQGEQILPGEYDYVDAFENYAYVGKDGKTAIANEKGLITDFKYDGLMNCNFKYDVRFFTYGSQFNRISVKKDDKWGCIDTLGREVIPFIYKAPVIYNINVETAKIRAEVTDYRGDTYWIDKDGNKIWYTQEKSKKGENKK